MGMKLNFENGKHRTGGGTSNLSVSRSSGQVSRGGVRKRGWDRRGSEGGFGYGFGYGFGDRNGYGYGGKRARSVKESSRFGIGGDEAVDRMTSEFEKNLAIGKQALNRYVVNTIIRFILF
jgi:hypothetical protein